MLFQKMFENNYVSLTSLTPVTRLIIKTLNKKLTKERGFHFQA